MKAVLFDLDNTLYPEIDFVKSGFGAVAYYLSSKYSLDEGHLLARMLEILEREGRGKIFDHLLYDLRLYTEEEVKLLVDVYRSHQPSIHLYGDVLPTVSYLRGLGLHLGVVTDGMASVQRNKVAALGLGSLFDVITYSDELGQEHWKPSTAPYQAALNILRVPEAEAAYVGDDPAKDFIGPNRMGMLTIQVERQEPHNSVANAALQAARAKYTVSSLEEILPIIEEKHHAGG